MDHSHIIRGRCPVPRPGFTVPNHGSGSTRVIVPLTHGSSIHNSRVNMDQVGCIEQQGREDEKECHC
jgi:hypothetical protein